MWKVEHVCSLIYIDYYITVSESAVKHGTTYAGNEIFSSVFIYLCDSLNLCLSVYQDKRYSPVAR